MIYNIITISVELFLIGFLVAICSFFGVKRNRSQFFFVELLLSILGSFLGTLAEAWIRSGWELPILFHIILQFVLPILGAVVTLVIYRVSNNPSE